MCSFPTFLYGFVVRHFQDNIVLLSLSTTANLLLGMDVLEKIMGRVK